MKNETELLQECKLQLEYLNEKFGETGTTNALLTKIDAVLRQPAVMPSLPNGKRVLAALKELSDCFTDEERKTMFGNEA
jgi:hypothetical protein